MNAKALAAETLGTFFLLVAVVGSGIMGEQLSDGNVAIALLANSIATGAALFVLISIFGPFSGAHFNPMVSFFFYLNRQLSASQLAQYSLAQVLGAVLGVGYSHLMFAQDILQISAKERFGLGLWSAEFLASFGLLLSILGFLRHAPKQVPAAVALYITGAYWFTASTSFANPAVTLARAFTDSFAGIAPQHVVAFLVSQMLACLCFFVFWRWFTEE